MTRMETEPWTAGETEELSSGFLWLGRPIARGAWRTAAAGPMAAGPTLALARAAVTDAAEVITPEVITPEVITGAEVISDGKEVFMPKVISDEES